MTIPILGFGLEAGQTGRPGWKRLRGWVATGTTLICVVVLAESAEFPSLANAMRSADIGLLTLAFLLTLLTIVCKAARWRILYPDGERPTLRLAIVATAVGQVANWAAPARLGEVLRVSLASHEQPQARPGRGVALGIGVLVAEKLLDAMMLLLLVVGLALLGVFPAWLSTVTLFVAACAVAGGVVCALILRGRSPGSPVLAKLGRGLASLFGKRADSVLRHLGSTGEGFTAWLTRRTTVQALLWSIGAWGLGGFVNHVVLRSLDLDPGVGAAASVLALLYTGAAVPSLPGRLGVFQYLCVVALSPFGVTFHQAFAFSVALYAVVYLPPVAVGLISFVLFGICARPSRGAGETASGRLRDTETGGLRERPSSGALHPDTRAPS